MSATDREEALSHVYVAAVAAAAGYTLAKQDFDRDGVDVQVRAGGSMRPSLDLQLKATTNLQEGSADLLRYPLKRRNYDLLRESTMVPRLLVLLDLPSDEAEWLDVGAERLILRRCAYWASFANAPETANMESVTVDIRRCDRFNPSGLRELMEQARTGAIA